ncbi:MAG: MFS transporter [Candidatus Rokuibacteriota bacterium]
MGRALAGAGAFVVSLDSTVNIAFPAMATAFAVPAEQVRGVVISYVLTYALMSFVGGALGDRFGHRPVFLAGMALSGLGFAACGTASSWTALLVGRVVQGLAGGLVYGTTPALVTLAVPADSRGRALGFLNAAIGVGFAIGPLIAGAVVDRWGWAAVFFLRVPLALAVLAWGGATAPSIRGRVGLPLLSLPDVARATVLGTGALAFLAQAGIFAIWLLGPFYLLERRGLDTFFGGILFMLTPLGTALAAAPAGRLADRMGPWPPMAVGLGLEAAGLGVLSTAGPTTSAIVLAAALLAAGLGVGLFQAPNMTALMAQFPLAQQGVAGGFAFLARTLGTVGGVAVLAHVFAVVRVTAGFDVAFARACAMAAAAVGLAALAALVVVVSRPRQAERRL